MLHPLTDATSFDWCYILWLMLHPLIDVTSFDWCYILWLMLHRLTDATSFDWEGSQTTGRQYTITWMSKRKIFKIFNHVMMPYIPFSGWCGCGRTLQFLWAEVLIMYLVCDLLEILHMCAAKEKHDFISHYQGNLPRPCPQKLTVLVGQCWHLDPHSPVLIKISADNSPLNQLPVKNLFISFIIKTFCH